ncbi:MAG TPA: START-like domain-containing protein [Taishania sp.]|nr:START-like domain-containing protein [Taishania sp.]
MKDKVNFELEYVLKTSPKVLDNSLFTPSGLSEWFCDDVNVKDGIYSFEWDGYVEEARLLSFKQGQHIKWRWLEDEEEGYDSSFGFKYHIDPITNAVILIVYGSAFEDEVDEAKALWEQHISDLKRKIGA